ncbi:hypothetical protein [Colwellia sp. MB3u-55]|uniref:hypothetical protein n=1 Tax=Colwellia sp. MB3u-55 TaxID=2759810 RepID=UPI0015F569FC|nr:hypothetical protein [Colwellia sp. MB3u-55]MBA6251341.1 hypothetical protein [Colwellia sp. MB3u-55]
MPMKLLYIAVIFVISFSCFADQKEDVAVKYFEFLFLETESINKTNNIIATKPLVSSFYSKNGHRMIIVSASLSSGKSFYSLMSVNELNMGLLSWKARGYGITSQQDIENFMLNNGTIYDFTGW